MTAPLMVAVAGHLVRDGFAVLRFNFRGVGGSGGTWSGGIGEMDDVAAAIASAAATYPALPLGIAGWSFGAATSLRWQAREQSTIPYAGIAPPVASDLTPHLPRPHELAPAPRTFILGDRDQFVTVGDLERYSNVTGATLHVIRGSDHFFYFREERVGALVAEALAPPAAASSEPRPEGRS
jgi:alpha/beta superfamily hydrolase